MNSLQEQTYYGVTFRGYCDEYRFSTCQSFHTTSRKIKSFYTLRAATINEEQVYSFHCTRGSKLASWLGGFDTAMPQTITVRLGNREGATHVFIHYSVPGFSIRIPPNNFRKEVLLLQKQIASTDTEPSD